MSRYDFERALEIRRMDEPFKALLFALMMKACSVCQDPDDGCAVGAELESDFSRKWYQDPLAVRDYGEALIEGAKTLEEK